MWCYQSGFQHVCRGRPLPS
ncbi:Protein of unknown function [Pyronema omphalodes CBS 100304]|uniref:Uncharacterized protein n=1 Tax=Pyronema omphalodes (strain CBS 100304) TaxID=1076935 RepID=U4LDG3_PYROM|nr:Protein of unknown function [Pyronema omphalodes CBS 100304]